MNAPSLPVAQADEAYLQLQVLTSLAEMHALTPEWNDLLAQCAGRNLFLTPAWNRAWWRAFGNGKSLHLLAIRTGARLIGLAIYMRYSTKLRGLPVRVLGSFTNPHVSRTDVLAAPGFETAVAGQIAAYFAQSSREWDVALLQQIPAAAPWVAPFLSAAGKHGLHACAPVAGIGKCRLPLTGNWDSYVTERGNHFRRNIGKTERRVERGGKVVYRHSINPAADAADFTVFADVERRSWKDDSAGTAHLGATGWAFQKEFSTAYDEGITCDNWIVELDGKPVTIVHTVGYDRVSYCFQTLYDEQARDLYVGRAAITRHFQSVFDEGRYDVLDLNGNSDFCKSWCATEQPFISLQIFNRRPYSLTLSGLKRLWGRR